MSGDQERKRPVFYARASSLGQDAEETLNHQRDAIAAGAANLDLDVHQEYVDREPGDNHTSIQEA